MGEKVKELPGKNDQLRHDGGSQNVIVVKRDKCAFRDPFLFMPTCGAKRTFLFFSNRYSLILPDQPYSPHVLVPYHSLPRLRT